MSNLVGKTIQQYHIVEYLGRGPLADTYKAHHPGLNRYVCLKVLRDFQADEASRARFEKELKTLAGFTHPHLASILGYDCEGETCFIVTEYIEGRSLEQVLNERKAGGKPFSPAEAATILLALGQALDYLHAQGIVHRYIKPANVIMSEAGQIFLTDFGLAAIIDNPSASATHSGSVNLATYLSPEQGRGEPGDARSDIYALDVLLYEMVTGKAPYQAGSPFELLLKHISQPVPRPAQANPDIPPAVEQVILKGLSKDPAERYQTAGDMARALQKAAALRVEPPPGDLPPAPMAPPSPPPSVNPPPSRSQPTLLERTLHYLDKNLARLKEKMESESSSPVPAPGQALAVSHLRLDAAVPKQVSLGRTFDLAVAVRQQSSPVLAEADLPQVRSGAVHLTWPESEPYAHLRLHVSAPECQVQGADAYTFRLYPGQDSPVFYFHLTPTKPGEISIIVTVYQESDWLGGTRLHTIAQAQAVGEVQLEVISRPVTAGPVEVGESLRRRLARHHSNLLKLQEQAAIFGIGETPLHLLNQIEAEQQAIAELEARLAEPV